MPQAPSPTSPFARLVSSAFRAVTGQAPAAAPATPPAPPAPSGPVTKAVLLGHSNAQAAQIFAGLLGDATDDKFKLDPRYQQVSYLFTLAGDGMLGDGRGCQVGKIEFESAALADQFFTNMLAASSDHWSRMYDGMAQSIAFGQGDIVGNMLAAEKANTAAAAARVVDGAGLKEFDVPVTFEAFLPQPAVRHDYPNQTSLLAAANKPMNMVQLDVSESRPVKEAAEEINTVPLADEMAQHTGGLSAEASGYVTVLASSAEDAPKMVRAMIDVYNMGYPRNVLTITGERIDTVTLLPREIDSDDDYDSGSERDRG